MVSFLKISNIARIFAVRAFSCTRSMAIPSLKSIAGVSSQAWLTQDAVNRAIPQDGGGGVDPVAEGGGELPQIVSALIKKHVS